MDGPNGTKILAVLPPPNGGFYIMAELGRDGQGRDAYVTAWMRELTDTFWTGGEYHRSPEVAMADVLERAGWRNVAHRSLVDR
jgi:hypothetical protein